MADSNLGAGKYWKSWKDMRKVAILFVTFTLLYLLHMYLLIWYIHGMLYAQIYTKKNSHIQLWYIFLQWSDKIG